MGHRYPRPIQRPPTGSPQEQRAAVAASWVGCMNAYFVFLEDPASVKTWSETIYQHLASRSMPLTLDQQQFWPIDALETFRLWVNQGWRLTPASPFDEAERIPPPDLPHPVKTRAPGHSRTDTGTTEPVPLTPR